MITSAVLPVPTFSIRHREEFEVSAHSVRKTLYDEKELLVRIAEVTKNVTTVDVVQRGRRVRDHASYAAIVEQGMTLYNFQRLFWAARPRRGNLPVRRDNELVTANFPDVDIALLSPAFLFPKTVPSGFSHGTEGPTKTAVRDNFLREIAKDNTWMRYQDLDFTSEDGRPIPCVHLSSVKGMYYQPSGKLRVWLQGGVHGNEPSGEQALLALIGKMHANQKWAKALLECMEIMILPTYNPDGAANFTRTLDNNVDPNRDHIKLASQQTRDIKKVFSRFAPHIVVDMHEYSGPWRYGGSFVHASDAQYSAAKNLNIHPDIRRMSESLFAAGAGERLTAAGFRWEPYVTGTVNLTPGSSILFKEAGSDGKLGRNAMGLTQSITFLCETRGIGLADQGFQRRTAAALHVVESVLQIAADNVATVYATIENSIRDFISSKDDIVITDSTNMTQRTFTMIDTTSGEVIQKPVKFANATPTTPKLIRQRPEAYLIPPSQAHVADRLRDMGIEIQILDHVYQDWVEALDITSASFDDTYFEGVVPVTVTTRCVRKHIEMPSGSFLVSTRQRNAALVFVALEPENIDSYVSSNIIPVVTGDEYPIYRVLS